MSDAQILDVLIVGFGPCGQVLAAQLGQLDHRVAVFERSPEPYPLPRAGHVDDEIVRVFQSIGAANSFEDRAVTPRGYEWLSADEELLFMIDWNQPTKSTWRSDYIFYQPYLEESLINAVHRNPSVEVHLGWEVNGVVERDGLVEVTMRQGHRESGRWTPTGVEQVVLARYVIGADGANSFLRTAAGIGYEDLGFEETLSIVDVRLHDPDMDIDMPDAGQICDPVRPISLFRWLGREHCRWEFMLMPGEDAQELVSEESSWKKLARWGVTPENASMIRRTLYTFNSLITEDFRRGRLLVVGDAAHLMPPFLGQGMCSGIRDTTNLSWKLDLVLKGVSTPRLLDSYTVERRPHVTAITETAIALGKVLCEIDPERASARNAALLSGHTPPTPPLPGLVEGILSHDESGELSPMAGQRSIQGHVTWRGRTGRFDDVVGGGWMVLSRKADLSARLTSESRALLARLDASMVHVTKASMADDSDSVLDRDGIYTEQFRELGVDVIVVRPDRYIYGATAEPAVDSMLDALRSQLELSQLHVG